MQAARVAISASFTAEPLREPLEYLLGLLGWNAEIAFAPFSQVYQTLFQPDGLFARNRGGVNVVLLRASDVADTDELASALESSAEHHGADLIVRLTPPDGADLEQELQAKLKRVTNIHVLEEAKQQTLYPVSEIHDSRAEALGAIPYTSEYFAALAAFLARCMHQAKQHPYKVAVLDCDDTLWRGVCGEDGPAGVDLDLPRRALQHFMRRQRAGGLLLAMASKNNEPDVTETFRLHPEMPLRLEDFAARRVNWDAKALSLGSLAAELNVALESFVFVDDNPKEAGEVAAEWPEVAAIALPPDPEEIPDFLAHVWAFDRAAQVTEEDRRRSESYAQESQRAGWQRQARSLEEFIAGLQLAVDFSAIRAEHLPRASQLTLRTNQMNTTAVRRSEAELAAFLSQGEGVVVHARDRFGDYGLVGLVLFLALGDRLIIDTFLLSCRALGRGVEHRMMRHVGEIAQSRGAQTVHVAFTPAPRNQPARDFLAALGREPFEFAADDLARTRYQPAQSFPTTETESHPVPRSDRRAPDYTRIAQLRNPRDLLEAIRTEKKTSAANRSANGKPGTGLENRLCALWADLLAVPSVGTHDNFFDLGGHSLLAVQLVSRLHSELGVDLPLEAVYTGTLTVAELARAIEMFELGRTDDPEYAALLAEIEMLSEEEAQMLLDRELGAEPRH